MRIMIIAVKPTTKYLVLLDSDFAALFVLLAKDSPQRVQNLAFLLFSKPHLLHFIVSKFNLLVNVYF